MAVSEGPDSAGPEAPTVDEYCRRIEGHLTRKNDGHLIRIVGPAFDRVRSWAEQGIPLNIAIRGIDRYFQRYYAKGPRRRPVRIEFCEADILDVFDEWRRAVGLTAGRRELMEGAATPRSPRDSLPRRIERTIARLTALRSGSGAAPDWRLPDAVLAAAVEELDGLAGSARSARGEVRERLLQQLAALDARLLQAAQESAGDERLATLQRQASEELAPFRDRMPADQWPRAKAAALNRLLRERTGLPVLPEGPG